jgi:multidrug efflux pump subunit AcrA (membrane-fusion protein)
LISTPEQLTPDQKQTIKHVKSIVGDISEADIYDHLQQANWDQSKAVAMLIESANNSANSWSDVVRKQRKEEKTTPPAAAPPQVTHDHRRQDRPPRQGKERRANGQANDERQQPAPVQQVNPQQQQQQQHHQQQQQQQQQHQQQQQLHQQQLHQQQQHYHHHQQMQQYQYQQQMQQQQQQLIQQQQQLQQQQLQQMHQQQQQLQLLSPADGEALIMGLSKAIEVQLSQIAEQSRRLMEMQTELESIHAAGKDQLTQLHEEKCNLLAEQERLQTQLTAVGERLIVVDKSIDKAEKEKLYKLQDWQRKSGAHNLLTGS